jgi:hypothetical protein
VGRDAPSGGVWPLPALAVPAMSDPFALVVVAGGAGGIGRCSWYGK